MEVMYPRLVMTFKIEAYVLGRPIPFSSKAFTSVPSVYRPGGWVQCCAEVTPRKSSESSVTLNATCSSSELGKRVSSSSKSETFAAPNPRLACLSFSTTRDCDFAKTTRSPTTSVGNHESLPLKSLLYAARYPGNTSCDPFARSRRELLILL